MTDRWYLDDPSCSLHRGTRGGAAIYRVDLGAMERLLVVRANGRETWTNSEEIALELVGPMEMTKAPRVVQLSLFDACEQ